MQYGRCSLQPPATLPTLCVFDREPLDVAATATALAAALARYPRDTHAVLLLDQPLLHAAHALHHALQVRLWCKTHISLHVGAPVPQDAPCTVVPAKSLPRLLLPRTPPPWLPPTPPPALQPLFSTDHSTTHTCSGLTWSLPPSAPSVLVWVGPAASDTLLQLQLQQGEGQWLVLDPATGAVTDGVAATTRALCQRRRYLIHRAREASVVGAG